MTPDAPLMPTQQAAPGSTTPPLPAPSTGTTALRQSTACRSRTLTPSLTSASRMCGTQYDQMMLAVSDLTAAGAAAPDQPMLISMFENALPQSYTVIRQMVRRQSHQTLLAYYNDILREARAELQSRAPSVHAFGASASQPAPQPAASAHDANIMALVAALQAMGYTKPGGKPGDGKKRSRDPYPSEPCLICGIEGHTREKCRKAANANPCRFCGKSCHGFRTRRHVSLCHHCTCSVKRTSSSRLKSCTSCTSCA